MYTEFFLLNPLKSIWPVLTPLELPSFISCQRLPLSFDILSSNESLTAYKYSFENAIKLFS